MFASEAPYLVTLGFDRSTFERLDRLRSRYFPPERNLVPARLSLFHQLPGKEGLEIDGTLFQATLDRGSIPLSFTRLKKTGGGILIEVEAPELASLHSQLSRAVSRWLTNQDRQAFQPHVTIMNKVSRNEASRAFEELQTTWSPWTGLGDRVILWHYRGGPWDLAESYDLKKRPAIGIA